MPASNPADFFKQKRNTAEIKAEIGTAFFRDWCALLKTDDENTAEEKVLVFLDGNAGAAHDAEGQALLPLKIMQNIAESGDNGSDLKNRFKIIFTDNSKATINKLREHLESLAFYDQLQPPPIILDITDQPAFLTDWPKHQEPAFLVVDPFSYGWAQELFAATWPQSNSDLLLVFDPAKMQKAVPATQPVGALQDFWGARLKPIQDFYLTTTSAVKREKFILDQFCGAFTDKQYYPLAFKINLPDKKRTSHYLVFASRSKAAYLKMKELLLLYSELQVDGIPLFGANLQDEAPAIPGFFRFSHPYCLENLIEELAQNKKEYHFQSIRQVYEAHSPGTNYVLQNYLTAFTALREQGQINILNSANKQVKTVTDAGVLFYKLHRTSIK